MLINYLKKSPLKGVVKLAIPIMVMNILHIFFNMADVAILGIFVGDNAMGAVGVCSVPIVFIQGLFSGIGGGATIVVSKLIGRDDIAGIKKTMGSAVILCFFCGALLAVSVFYAAKKILILVSCAEDILEPATSYLKIYGFAIPFVLLYNVLAGCLRADNDTYHSMIYLIITGVINVLLNIVFVKLLNKSTDGVALATLITQIMAFVMIFVQVIFSKKVVRIDFKYFRLYLKNVWEILKVGVPAGIAGCMFSFSNVLLNSKINSFGIDLIDARTVASQFENIITQVAGSIGLASMSYIGQNYGKKDYGTVKRIVWDTSICCGITQTVLVAVMIIFARQLCGVMTQTSKIIDLAIYTMIILQPSTGLYHFGESLGKSIMATGKSYIAMLSSMICICGFRLLWVYTVFEFNSTILTLFIVWPVSYVLFAITNFVIMKTILKKLA